MLKRTVTGAGITLGVYLILFCSHIPVVLPTALAVLNGIAVYECFEAAGMTRRAGLRVAVTVGAVVLSLIPAQGHTAIFLLVFGIAVVVFTYMMVRLAHCALDSPGKILGIVFLITVLSRAVLEVRALPKGFYYLVFAVTLCFVTDMMAYLVGKTVGCHKLSPRISPNKTVEGSIGGIVGAVLAMLLLAMLLENNTELTVHYGMLVLYAVLASVAGQFGDLAMSAVKRVCGVKDFGTLFPGHGGVLDRFDSHIFSIGFTLLFCAATGGYLS